MKLYKIWQEVNQEYDTYDSAVVAAKTIDDARLVHPSGYKWNGNSWIHTRADGSECEMDGIYSSWCNPKDVSAELIGNALDTTETSVIVASFNAG